MIHQVTYEEVLPLWNKLWANRVSPIERESWMCLVSDDREDYAFSNDFDPATFLGIYEDGRLVAVNSFHRIRGTTRSRGLYVEPEYRGRGYAYNLLRETWQRCPVAPLWSFPKQEAIKVYQKAGFRVISNPIYSPLEHKINYYVTM